MQLKKLVDYVENFGTGPAKPLTNSQLVSLENACKKLRTSLVDNCVSHALYRGALFSRGGDIYLLITGSDIKGTLEEVELCYDLSKRELYTRGIEFSRGCDVGSDIYNLLVELDKLPINIGLLDIPIEGKFKEGKILYYTEEQGTYLIHVEDSLDNSAFRP